MRPAHWRMMADIAAVLPRRASDPGCEPRRRRATLGDFLDDGGYGPGFRQHFLVPITSAVWSTGADRILDFPIDYLLRFLDNHGLIGYGNALQWRTIQGGSMRYVDRIVAALPAGVDPGRQPGRRTWRATQTGATVRTADGVSERFDAVVMATHADDALRSSSTTPTRWSAPLWPASSTRPTASCSTPIQRVLPRRAPARARHGTSSRPTARGRARQLTMTYHMNRLQSLGGPVDYCVSVNPGDRVRPDTILADRAMQPSDVHVPDAGRPGRPCALCRAAVDLVRRSAPRLRLPRGRLSVRLRSRRGAPGGRRRAGGMRSHLLEGNVRHRRVRPFAYALEHEVFYFALDLDELDEVPRRLRLDQPGSLEPAVVPGRRSSRSAGRRSARHRFATTCAARASIRTAGASRSSPTSACSAMCSTRPASSCAGTEPATCRR